MGISRELGENYLKVFWKMPIGIVGVDYTATKLSPRVVQGGQYTGKGTL